MRLLHNIANKTVGAGMIKQKCKGKKSTHKHSYFELEFNTLVRKHFPHWEAKDISNISNLTL